ncbi:hypothetical protein ERO13_D04G151450v2 [Gossypium hirsutum]|nr:hypothetical protein ERO13_D04G151450v2 [Gossypium hirsutum]
MKGGSLFCSKVPRLGTPPPTSPHHHYRRWLTTSDHGEVPVADSGGRGVRVEAWTGGVADEEAT